MEMVNFSSIFGLWRTLVMGLMLLFLNSFARADIWGYVDERGTAHFAAEREDARYVLFFKGLGEFDSRRDGPADAGLGLVPPTPPTGASLKLLSLFSLSPGYQKLGVHLREASRTHGVDYALLQALIATESGFDSQAVSPKGAVGLMQLMPDTARRYGVASDAKTSVEKKLTDPGTNIKAGTRYLRYLIDLFPGRLELALAAYNAGEGAVQRAGTRSRSTKKRRTTLKPSCSSTLPSRRPLPTQVHRPSPRRVCAWSCPPAPPSRELGHCLSGAPSGAATCHLPCRLCRRSCPQPNSGSNLKFPDERPAHPRFHPRGV